LRNGGVQCKLKVLSSFNVWSRGTLKRFKIPPLRKHKRWQPFFGKRNYLMRIIIIHLLLTGLVTTTLSSCSKKANESQKTNQLYVTDKGDSLETGFWTFEPGPNGVSSSGNFSDGFRTDKWTYSTYRDTTTFMWKIFTKDSLKLNIPDYVTLTNQEKPTVFFGNIKNKDEHCYFTLLTYDLEEVKASVYDYLYQAIESMEKSTFETLESREVKKYTFKNIEVFRVKIGLKGTRKYQAISYIFVIDNLLYDLTYRDFSEDIDKIEMAVFNDILYSFESSEKDLFSFNNKHYLKEEDVIINTPKQN